MKIRPIRIDGDSAFITLTRGYEAIIDVADVELVNSYNWYALGIGRRIYAARKQYTPEKTYCLYLHRQLMDEPLGMEVDHINTNTLDDRRGNLRVVTKRQNQHNRRAKITNKTGLKGVYLHNKKNKWHAQINVGNRKKSLGYFDSAELAHDAYVIASLELHGEFSRFSSIANVKNGDLD